MAEKKRIYECKHYKYEYDDLGKYAWCRNPNCLSRECFIEYKFCQDQCPFYEKNDDGRCVEIEDDEHYREFQASCQDKITKDAASALEEAKKALKSANEKIEYAKQFSKACKPKEMP